MRSPTIIPLDHFVTHIKFTFEGVISSRDLRRVVLGDINGDGSLDALVANFSLTGTLTHTVWLNDGNGAFTAHPTTPGFGGASSEAIDLGDIDGDGDLDAVIANF